MKYLKKTILIMMLFFSCLEVYAINMSTTIFDKRIDNQNGYSEIIFENNSATPIRYKISTLSPDGEKKDMSRWVTLSPKILTIPAYDKRPLKIFAKSPINTDKGEYAFNLKVDQVIIPTISKSGDKIKGNSMVTFTPIIEMLGYVGDPMFQENINLENIVIDKNKETLTGRLINKSYAGKELGISYIGSNNFVLGGGSLRRIKAGFNEKVTIPLNKNIQNNIKEILLYDINSLEEIKRIKLP